VIKDPTYFKEWMKLNAKAKKKLLKYYVSFVICFKICG
jgi:hypothetical protein